MARNVFFSFDFDDVMATNIVRNSNVVRAENMNLPFRDYSLYEVVKTGGAAAVRRAIDDGLEGTTVTVICTGGLTWRSDWVRYEIAKSLERGNALMVVDIDGVGPPPKPLRGDSPLDYLAASPWENAMGFDVLEYTGSAWVPFSKIPKVTRSESHYPASFYHGAPWYLSQRFKFRKHWNDPDIRLYFPTYSEIEAQAVGA
jgi:hypothetical protein